MIMSIGWTMKYLLSIANKQAIKEQWFTLTGGTFDIYESPS